MIFTLTKINPMAFLTKILEDSETLYGSPEIYSFLKVQIF